MNNSSAHRNHKKARSLLEMPTPIETNKFFVNVMDYQKQLYKLKHTSCFREVNKTKPSYYGEEIKNPIFPSPDITLASSIFVLSFEYIYTILFFASVPIKLLL